MRTPFTEQDILDDLDESGLDDQPYKFFLDLDHGYCYTASSRITLFADNHRWAIVMERSGYENRGTYASVELNYFGNCLRNLDRAGLGGIFISNTKLFPLIEREDLLKIATGFELVSPTAASIVVRGRKVPIEHNISRYNAKRIHARSYDNPESLPDFPALVRFLSEEYPVLFHANEVELRTCIPEDLPRLMSIDRWVHPEGLSVGFGDGPRPSSYDTFNTIAKILVARDTSLWNEPIAPNNDWRFHPLAGSL